jgi:nucleoside-diphosphate-sugar epimerase
MKLLVLGGSGFVGSALVGTAVAAGHVVTVLTRGSRPLPGGVSELVGDRTDHRVMVECFDRAGDSWDIVVDCIGYTAQDTQQDVDLFAQRAGHLVFVSSDAVLDLESPLFPKGEECGFGQTEYGSSKRAAEVILEEAETGRMRWTILRPTHVYGPGSWLGCQPWHLRDPSLIDRLERGESLRLIGGGRFLQQPIAVNDLALLILSCAGNAAVHRKAVLAAGPDTIEARGYYQVVAEALGVALSVEEVPVSEFVGEHPELAFVAAHRAYGDVGASLLKLGLHVPQTRLRAGLLGHVEHLRQLGVTTATARPEGAPFTRFR